MGRRSGRCAPSARVMCRSTRFSRRCKRKAMTAGTPSSGRSAGIRSWPSRRLHCLRALRSSARSPRRCQHRRRRTHKHTPHALIGCAAHHQSVRQARVSFGYSAQGVERSSMEAGSAGPSSRVYWTQRRPCGAAGAMTTAHVMPRARVGAPEGTSAVMTPGAPFRRLILGCALFVALVSALDFVVLLAHREAVEAQTAALIGAVLALVAVIAIVVLAATGQRYSQRMRQILAGDYLVRWHYA